MVHTISRVKAQAAQEALLVRQGGLFLQLLGSGPVQRVMQLVGGNRSAAFGDGTGAVGGAEAAVPNVVVVGESDVLPERVLVGGSPLGGAPEEEKIPEPPFSGEGNRRQEGGFGVACGGRNRNRNRNSFILGVADDVGDSQGRQGPASFAERTRKPLPPSRALLLFCYEDSFRGGFGGGRGVEGADFSGVEELVGGEGRGVGVGGEVELEIFLCWVLFPEEGNRGGETCGAGGGAEEEGSVAVGEALGAGGGGDEGGGAVAVKVEIRGRSHHLNLHFVKAVREG